MFSPSFLPAHNFPQAFPFIKLSSINHDHHLHLTGFSPLRKILAVNHYLHSPDFQHQVCLSQFRCFFLFLSFFLFRIKVANLDLPVLGSAFLGKNAIPIVAAMGTGVFGTMMEIGFRYLEHQRDKMEKAGQVHIIAHGAAGIPPPIQISFGPATAGGVGAAPAATKR